MQRIWEGKLEELRDVDDQVRDLVRTLSETGQLDNTVIMMVSDNGYLLGEHRLFQKKQPYEESTGIPFVVRGPGFAPGAPRALVSQVDLMPTTLEVAGLDPDDGRTLEGRSMLAPLRTGDWSGWRRRLLVENPHLGWALLREGPMVFVDHHDRGEHELYDLADDPHQLRSLHRENAIFAAGCSFARGSAMTAYPQCPMKFTPIIRRTNRPLRRAKVSSACLDCSASNTRNYAVAHMTMATLASRPTRTIPATARSLT